VSIKLSFTLSLVVSVAHLALELGAELPWLHTTSQRSCYSRHTLHTGPHLLPVQHLVIEVDFGRILDHTAVGDVSIDQYTDRYVAHHPHASVALIVLAFVIGNEC
jgi:hypothetical protein